MASLTARLKLRKPAPTDTVDVAADVEAVYDAIDAAMGYSVVTSTTRPASPYVGETIFESDTLRLYVYFNSTWNRINYDGGPDTATVGNGTGTAYQYLNGGAGSFRALRGLTGGAVRWLLGLGDATAESGGNAGSNFSIYRYDDAGAYAGTPVTISRLNGVVQLLEGLTVGSVSTTNLVGSAATYTPVLTNWALGNGTVYGYYYKIGRLVFFKVAITFGSTSTFVGNPVISMPFAASAATNNFHIFECAAVHSSVSYPLFTAIGPGYGTCAISAPQVSGANIQANPVTSTIPFPWGNGDQIRIEGWFEAAA